MFTTTRLAITLDRVLQVARALIAQIIVRNIATAHLSAQIASQDVAARLSATLSSARVTWQCVSVTQTCAHVELINLSLRR